MIRPSKLILSQGDLDGACFLYSLANAALGLGISRDRIKPQWAKAVKGLLNPKNFLDSKTGSKENKNAAGDHKMASEFLRALAPGRFTVDVLETKVGLIGLAREHLNARTILVVDDGPHWFCIVDIEGSTLHAACSARWNEKRPYLEWKTLTGLKLKRRANVKLRPTVRPHRLNRALKITLQ